MKMRLYILILLITGLSVRCSKNPNDIVLEGGQLFTEIAILPDFLEESSGIEVAAAGGFWSFNDSKGHAELYRIDTLGDLLQTIEVLNATNVDWEDMAKDDEGFLYISDSGNNDNDRQDLIVYKLPEPTAGSVDIQAVAENIRFSFPDQTEFPPPKSEHFFDVEGIFSSGSFLYLLTRDRSKPFVGKTRLYRLPKVAGEYSLEFLGEFMTDKDKDLGKVTSADISPDGSKLAMLSCGIVWLFEGFTGDEFFSGEVDRIELPLQWDWEGIVFNDDCTLYMTKEKGSNKPGLLYKMTLCN